MKDGHASSSTRLAPEAAIALALGPMRAALRDLATVEERGRVSEVLGTLVKAVGVQARIGEIGRAHV